MTVLASSFIRLEKMKTFAVAYLALYVHHEDMLCMAIGFSQGDRALGYLAKMTALAFGPRPFSPMGPRKLALSFHDVCDEKLVLLDQAQVMALLADDVPVLAPLPLFKGLLHHVARHAEFRVLLGMPVILVSDHSAEYRDDGDQCEYKALQMVQYHVYQF